jgi:hypothetical protein
MSEVQKRRWLALAQTFHTLPESEQARLHERMTAWASLSIQQRNQARINFAATQRLRLDDKRSQWDAYQALSEEENDALRPVPPPNLGAQPRPSNPYRPRSSPVFQPPKRLRTTWPIPRKCLHRRTPPRIAAPGGGEKRTSEPPVAPAPAQAPAATASSAADSMAPAMAPDASAPAPTGTPAEGPSSNIYIN